MLEGLVTTSSEARGEVTGAATVVASESPRHLSQGLSGLERPGAGIENFIIIVFDKPTTAACAFFLR
jgi:hypothetical protein